jgi:hypothetical protein
VDFELAHVKLQSSTYDAWGKEEFLSILRALWQTSLDRTIIPFGEKKIKIMQRR